MSETETPVTPVTEVAKKPRGRPPILVEVTNADGTKSMVPTSVAAKMGVKKVKAEKTVNPTPIFTPKPPAEIPQYLQLQPEQAITTKTIYGTTVGILGKASSDVVRILILKGDTDTDKSISSTCAAIDLVEPVLDAGDERAKVIEGLKFAPMTIKEAKAMKEAIVEVEEKDSQVANNQVVLNDGIPEL